MFKMGLPAREGGKKKLDRARFDNHFWGDWKCPFVPFHWNERVFIGADGAKVFPDCAVLLRVPDKSIFVLNPSTDITSTSCCATSKDGGRPTGFHWTQWTKTCFYFWFRVLWYGLSCLDSATVSQLYCQVTDPHQPPLTQTSNNILLLRSIFSTHLYSSVLPLTPPVISSAAPVVAKKKPIILPVWASRRTSSTPMKPMLVGLLAIAIAMPFSVSYHRIIVIIGLLS